MVATTNMRFKPDSFQQMAGLVLYYNTFLFHYLFLSSDEKKGLCLQIYSCDDGKSVFPLGSSLVEVGQSDLYLKATLIDSGILFSRSDDKAFYNKFVPEFDASILSDDYGSRWGFTGTFIALSCQDLTGNQCRAEFDYLDLKTTISENE